MRDWWELMEQRGTSPDAPMKPQVPAWALNDALADDAIVCGDSGTVTTWAARQIKIRRGQMFSFSGTNCSMAAGLPYAIGAQAAFPGRQVVVFTGDGSLTMQLGDFLTCRPARAADQDRRDQEQHARADQVGADGLPRQPRVRREAAPLDFVKFAEACGARGIRIEDPARCRDQLAEALSWDGPVIIECVTDEHEPPYPGQGQAGPGH